MRAIFFAMLLSACSICRASSVTDRPMDEIVGQSYAFVRVTIQSLTASCESKRHCGVYKYTASVDAVLKGQLTGADRPRLKFCSLLPLHVGATYTLALTHSTSFFDLPGCGFSVAQDSVFERRGAHHYRVSSFGTSLIVDFEGKTYWTDAVRVPDFEDKLRCLGVDGEG